MPECCIKYVDLDDEIIEDITTICGDTLSAFDLATLLSSDELLDNPLYEIIFKGGNYTDGITLNGSVIDVNLKNPDSRPYEEVIIASLTSDNFKYKVSIKIKFKDRCEGSTCVSPQVCNPCTGDCEQGIVDASISIIDPKGSTDLSISIK